jgi:hypothetical protein
LNLRRKIYKAEVNLVDTWLSRTKQHPLFIEIFHSGQENTISKLEIPSALVASCTRWELLQLSGSHSWLRGGALDGVRNRLSSLQILSMQGDVQRVHTGAIDIFEHTPQLRCYRFRYAPVILPFNERRWAQLTELSAKEITILQYYQILSHARGLEICTFSKISECPDEPLPQLCLPHLRSLTVGQSSMPGTMLDYLTLPALSALDYNEISTSTTALSRSSLVAFLSRSMCSLEKLILGLVPNPAANTLEILRLFPSLSQFRLNGCVTYELLSGLMLDSNPVVPNLHTLVLIDNNGTMPTPEVADMIESRMTQLKRVRVPLNRKIMTSDHQKTWTRLQKLRDEGLDIVISWDLMM